MQVPENVASKYYYLNSAYQIDWEKICLERNSKQMQSKLVLK